MTTGRASPAADDVFFEGRKDKRAHLTMDPLYLVRLAGIEPTTPWFVAKYSIQLSYSRKTSTTFHEQHGGETCYNKTRQSLIFSILVRLAGIEPTTPWFVAKYSIQLCYSRAGKHYSVFISL